MNRRNLACALAVGLSLPLCARAEEAAARQALDALNRNQK